MGIIRFTLKSKTDGIEYVFDIVRPERHDDGKWELVYRLLRQAVRWEEIG